MTRFAKLGPLLVMSLGATPALADGTVQMTLQSLSTPSGETANTASVWAARIKDNNVLFKGNPSIDVTHGGNAPFFAESALLTVGGKQVFVSVGSSLSTCDNDNSGTQSYGMCDVRIVVVQNGKATMSDAGKACFVTPNDSTDTGYATLSRDGGSIALTASINGTFVAACNVTVPIP